MLYSHSFASLKHQENSKEEKLIRSGKHKHDVKRTGANYLVVVEDTAHDVVRSSASEHPRRGLFTDKRDAMRFCFGPKGANHLFKLVH